MRRPAEFEQAVRRGARSGTGSLVVHLASDQDAGGAAHVGFVVAKSVGNAVVRNRVKRRLRAQMSHRIDQLPDGGRLVVRALPGSADLDSAALARDLDRALAGATRRLHGRPVRSVASGR
jgi:ribonuclease P protein component